MQAVRCASRPKPGRHASSRAESPSKPRARLAASADDVDLSSVGRFMPDSVVVPQAGNGDVAVDLEWRRARLVGGDVKLALSDVQLPAVRGTAGSQFDRIAFGGDWRLGDGDWHIDLKDVAVTREGRAWPVTSNAEIDLALDGDGGLERLSFRSAFLRLEDLTPFLWPLPVSRPLDAWFALAPHGDLRAVSVDVSRADEKLDYTLAMQFARLGFAAYNDLPGVTALTGEMRAD